MSTATDDLFKSVIKPGFCQCGCGYAVPLKRKFVSGHNRKGQITGELHRKRIGAAQRRAWNTKRKRLPVGTKRVDNGGYTIVKTEFGSGRWRPEHAIVIEQIEGMPIADGEEIHHINKRRTDNRPENLFRCRSKTHHAAVECSLTSVISKLVDLGLITFDRERGIYETVL